LQNFNGSKLRTEEELTKLKQEKCKLEEELQKFESEKKDLKTTISTLELEKKELKSAISFLEKEKQQLKDKLSKEKEDTAKVLIIRFKFVLLNSYLKFFNTQILDQLRQDLDSQQTQVDNYHRENLHLNIQLKKYIKEATDLTAQLQAASKDKNLTAQTNSKQLDDVSKACSYIY
jgi:septal ring factor EnvC (AmiA/AmiB activator)